jgi:hypothetical protein
LLGVKVHAILLHSLALLKTSTLLPGLNGVLKAEYLLEPETIVPAPPDLVVIVRRARDGGMCGDGCSVGDLVIDSREDADAIGPSSTYSGNISG